MLSDSGVTSAFWLQAALARVSFFFFWLSFSLDLQLSILLKHKHSVREKVEIFLT